MLCAGLENDEYTRKTDGYLPTAEVAFIDEIFKANSAILNALLTLLNERLFDNGNQRLEVPLLCLVSLPALLCIPVLCLICSFVACCHSRTVSFQTAHALLMLTLGQTVRDHDGAADGSQGKCTGQQLQ